MGGYHGLKMMAKNPTVQKEAKEYAARMLSQLDNKAYAKYLFGEQYMAPYGKDSKIADLIGIPQELEKFGKNYSKYKNNPKEAIEHLMDVKRGQVRSALYHPEIGEIDIAWGKVTDSDKHEGYGLAHIIDKHGEEVARNLDDIVMGGKVSRKKGNSVEIVNDDYMAVIKMDWYGKEKQWVVTTFDMPPYQSITDGMVSGGKSGNLSPQAHEEIIHPNAPESQALRSARKINKILGESK
jgi:hypothetical protein